MILHMLPIAEWEALVEVDAQTYRAASLESEGFIHCTKEPELLVRVANSFYREIPVWLFVLAFSSMPVTSVASLIFGFMYDRSSVAIETSTVSSS